MLLAAGLWAAIHLQYDWFGIAQVFCLGLLFGWVRWRSGIDPAHDADAFRVKPRCGDRDGRYHPVVPGAEPFRARENGCPAAALPPSRRSLARSHVAPPTFRRARNPKKSAQTDGFDRPIGPP